MNKDEILELLEQFRASDINLLEIKDGDFALTLKKDNCVHKVFEERVISENHPIESINIKKESEKAASSLIVIKAPLVGIFYAAEAPEKEPFVKEGQQVKKGETICLLEAMKIISELKAPQDCIIRRILVKNSEGVEFDQTLFEVEPC